MSTLDINSIRDYLIEVGCKVEYPILVNAFKKHLYNPDPNIQSTVRTQFKDYVNRLSTVNVENNMKFITLRPEFRPAGQLSSPPHNGHTKAEPLQPKQQQQLLLQKQQPSPPPPLPPPMLTSSPKRHPPCEFFPNSNGLTNQQSLVAGQHREPMAKAQLPPPLYAIQTQQKSTNDRLDSPRVSQMHNDSGSFNSSPIQPVHPRRQLPQPSTPRPPPPIPHHHKPSPAPAVNADMAPPPPLMGDTLASRSNKHDDKHANQQPNQNMQLPSNQWKQQYINPNNHQMQQQQHQQHQHHRSQSQPMPGQPQQSVPQNSHQEQEHQQQQQQQQQINFAYRDQNLLSKIDNKNLNRGIDASVLMPPPPTPFVPLQQRQHLSVSHQSSLDSNNGGVSKGGHHGNMPPPRPPPRRRQSTASLHKPLPSKSIDRSLHELARKSISDRARGQHPHRSNSSASFNDLSPSMPKRNSSMKENRLSRDSTAGSLSSSFQTIGFKRSRSSHRGEDESDSSSLQPNDPLRRKWNIEASSCNYNNLMLLLREDPKLAFCKDVMNGYTGLHWAAKFGNLEIIRLIAGTYGVPVNIKSSAGHTPLHVAYMFNRIEAVNLLLQSYQANSETRDHSGKKPMQYWQKPSATSTTNNK